MLDSQKAAIARAEQLELPGCSRTAATDQVLVLAVEFQAPLGRFNLSGYLYARPLLPYVRSPHWRDSPFVPLEDRTEALATGIRSTAWRSHAQGKSARQWFCRTRAIVRGPLRRFCTKMVTQLVTYAVVPDAPVVREG